MSDPRYENIGDPISKLIEECAELIHACCKYQHFGPFNYHPEDPNKTPNYQLVYNEILDVEKQLYRVRKIMVEQAGTQKKDSVSGIGIT